MSSKLDCHPASAEEILTAHRNVFDVWPTDSDIDLHVAKRKDSPKSLRANYFVGTIDGKVATSLQSFPTLFQVGGRTVKGIQIGSVHTHADFRKLGYAELLIDFTEKYEAERGIELSVLYCDISLKYYQKMAYQEAPSKSGWFVSDEWSEERLDSVPDLAEIAPRDELNALMNLHQPTINQRPIGILRDEEYWDYTLRKFPNDFFWGIKNADGELSGFVRVGIKDGVGEINDWVCRDDSPELIRQLMLGMTKKAKAMGLTKIGGWLPDCPTVTELVGLQERPKQITMFKSLSSDLNLEPDLMATANYFTQIDHV
ncbi:hypothetical protein Pla110_20480 [Polystyrenella longa]|uniref:N-acetyltransferase domain-containing protein n=1 Tax=Polystyrenella longa TaxID=2528007 RepID=A0A518CM58_9PLAN|nr:GNAT family N-acetyltransferase [Polystyrenella longa]QDU80321.1 hypothetical protein Pla110_20480 [Polystyrenella longa]